MKDFLEMIINLFYPSLCAHCKKNNPTTGRSICNPCISQLGTFKTYRCFRCDYPFKKSSSPNCPDCNAIQFVFDQSRSVYSLNNVGKKIIHQIKFQRKSYLLNNFKTDLINKFRTEYENKEIDYLIPLPSSFFRTVERGFTPSEQITKMLHQEFKIPVLKNIFYKAHRKRQSLSSRKERLTNQIHSFKIRPTSLLENKTLLVVDDIFTTGATVNELSKVARNFGAKTVFVLTLFRSP